MPRRLQTRYSEIPDATLSPSPLGFFGKILHIFSSNLLLDCFRSCWTSIAWRNWFQRYLIQRCFRRPLEFSRYSSYNQPKLITRRFLDRWTRLSWKNWSQDYLVQRYYRRLLNSIFNYIIFFYKYDFLQFICKTSNKIRYVMNTY